MANNHEQHQPLAAPMTRTFAPHGPAKNPSPRSLGSQTDEGGGESGGNANRSQERVTIGFKISIHFLELNGVTPL